jgi:hypothetical protein
MIQAGFLMAQSPGGGPPWDYFSLAGKGYFLYFDFENPFIHSSTYHVR